MEQPGGTDSAETPRVHNFSISLDGYGAGPGQDIDNPIGVRGRDLHKWAFQTRTYRRMLGMDGGDEGLDDGSRGGRRWHRRHDHGPQHVRPDPRRRGRRRAGRAGGATTRRTTTRCSCSPTTRATPFAMEGGTTFHFVTDGIEAALERALRGRRRRGRHASAAARDRPAVPARRPDRRAAPRDRRRSCSARRAAVRQPRRRSRRLRVR